MNKDSIQFDLKTDNLWGKIAFNGSLGRGVFDQKKRNKTFVLNALIDNLEISRLRTINLKAYFGGNVRARGDFSELDNPQLSWWVEDASLNSSKTSINGISLEGKLEEQQVRNTLSVNSVPISLKSDFLYNYRVAPPPNYITGQCKSMGFKFFGLTIRRRKEKL